MPYFITDKGKDCAGWATVKANGEVIGCHQTKAGAIKQMVAVSLAEKMKPGGQRALNDELEVGDFVFWDNAGHTEFGLITFVSTFGQVVDQLGSELIATQDKPLAKISIYVLDGTTLVGTDRFAVMPFAPLSKLDIDRNDSNNDQPNDNNPDSSHDGMNDNYDGYDDGNRALPQAVIVDIDDTLIHFDKPMQRVIDYVNALPGRKYIVTGRMQSDHDRTVRQLRSAGVEYSALFMKQVDEPTTIFKRRIATKLKGRFHISLAIDNDESNRAVFRDLGIPTLNPASIGKDELPAERHLPGKHDQSTHGRGGGGAGAMMGRIPLDEGTVRDMRAGGGGSAAPHIIQNADGTYSFTPERQALHDKIVSQALAGVPVSDNPTVVFLGGGAASGKSTAVASSGIAINEKHVKINPDDVKKKLPEYKQKSAEEAAKFTHEESSYISKRIQAAAIQRQNDIVLDAVGDTSADSMSGKIVAAKAKGYKTVGTYVTIPTAKAQIRARERGIKEGRVVPPEIVAAGHRGVSNTFPQIASKFDEVSLFSNDVPKGSPLKLIGSGKNGTFNVEDQGLWSEFLAKGSE